MTGQNSTLLSIFLQTSRRGGREGGGGDYLEGAQHGQEGLSNDKAEEQVTEGSNSKAS